MAKRKGKGKGKRESQFDPGEVESGVERIVYMTATDYLADQLDVCYEVADMVQVALREYTKGKKGQEKIRKAQRIHDARMEGEDA